MPPTRLARAAFRAAAVLAAGVLACAPAAAQIRNTATLTFSTPAGARSIASNTVSLDIAKRPTTLSFRKLPADFAYKGLSCQTSPTVQMTPGTISAAQLAAMAPAKSPDVERPLAIVLTADAENRQPTVRETAWISIKIASHVSQVPLMETKADSGVFAGAFPAANSNPDLKGCDLPIKGGGTIELSFDGSDDSDASDMQLLIDPEGYVFDAVTGETVDGAVVTLIDEATGEPAATVYGDDGTSAYPNTVVSGGEVTDAGGEVYRFASGNFRFPLAPPGRYHLKVLPPVGYRAPSLVGPDLLAGLAGGRDGGYIVTEASYGKPFVLADPAPLQIDVPLDPTARREARNPVLTLEKTASVRDAAPGDLVQYRLALRNGGAGPTRSAVRITDTLPQGFRYRVGSVRGAVEPGVSSDGRTLTFDVARLAPKGVSTLTYVASVGAATPTGEAVNTALASAVDGSSNTASAAVRIRPPLMTGGFTLTGRITEGGCGDPARGGTGVPGIRLVLEDGSFAVTDKDGLYHVEGVRPGTHVVQIDTASLPPTLAPVACDRDTRSAGSSVSRFVEAGGGGLQRVDFQLARTGKPDAAAAAPPIAPVDDAAAAGSRADWLAGAAPGIGWLFPEVNHNPRAPALRVVIRHLPSQRVALSVNGRPVDPLSFDGTDVDLTRGVAVSRWTGLPLADHDNRLEARVLGPDGAPVQVLTRTVHYANVPLRVALDQAASRLVADGLSRPLVALRVTDRDGHPVRAGTLVPFRVDQPYRAAQAGDAEQARQLAGLERTQATARVVGDDGLAFAALQPTTQAGSVRLSVTLADGQVSQVSEVSARLEAPVRDWMVVGFGRGTIGYDLLRRNASALPPGERNRLFSDGQLALYAKGRVAGRWLLTLAYDSDRRFDPERGLLGTIDPDRYYTVYGDGSAQGHDAPTRGRLYLRLERRAFVALFGDFETGFTDTRLARYSRTLSGFKAEAAGERLLVAAFAAHDDERYARDEIAGNGLSGPYRLSARDIVPGSDKITLETRDRLRAERILASRPMTRHIDYDIDPVAATIRFREPILGRDAGLNPVFIVVDYETQGPGRKLAAGARAAARIAGGRAQVGATLLHDQAQSDATVAAVDLRASPAKGVQLRAEAATGGRGSIGGGTALMAEAEYHGAVVDALGYARRQDTGFGLGQQNAGEGGTAKVGIDARVRLTGQLSATVSGWRQDDLIGPARRAAGEARLEQRGTNGTVFVGTQLAADRGLDGGKHTSALLTLGGTRSVLDQRLELSGQAQLALGGRNDSTDFPARQQIGASWRISPGVRLVAGYEVAKGNNYFAHNARVGFDVAPWTGAHLLSTMNRQAIGENGTRTFAQYGLSQSLPLGKRWSVDATLDASSTLAGRLPAGTAAALARYPSSALLGQSLTENGFVAATLGASYRSFRWSWNGRAEMRRESEAERLGVTANLLRTLGEGRTLASSLRAFRVRDGRSGAAVTSASADLALAWRPLGSRWSLLERFELRHEGADIGVTSSNVLAVPTFAAGDQTTVRAINNLALSYRSGDEGGARGVEASVYYGAKYMRGRYADERIEGFIQAAGVEVRRDIGARLDLGFQLGAQHGWSDGTLRFAAGPMLGLAAAREMWITAGYNMSGYRDRDYADARYTRAGPYLTLRAKLAPGLLGLGKDHRR